MASLIRAFDDIDRDIAQSIENTLDPGLILQTLEIGSLRSWFTSVLRAVPDEHLKKLDWRKVVGALLVKAKHKMIKWLEGKETIRNAEEVKVLRDEITQLKNEVEQLRHIPIQAPVPLKIIVIAVQKISMAIVSLPQQQKLSYASNEGVIELNRKFSVTNEQLEKILTQEFTTEKVRMPLTIKKPDYLGISKWDVIANGHPISVKISDEQWIKRFHERQIKLLPGDALSADVRIDNCIDEEGRTFESKYTVEHIYDIIKINQEQMKLFEEGNRNDLEKTTPND